MYSFAAWKYCLPTSLLKIARHFGGECSQKALFTSVQMSVHMLPYLVAFGGAFQYVHKSQWPNSFPNISVMGCKGRFQVGASGLPKFPVLRY
jgi:hypothetical protein